MRIFLDSVDFKEIEDAFGLGILKGLTTTPTFMHRKGITDINSAIVKLSGMVPELHVEALGKTSDEIIEKAHELLSLPLSRKPVFKIPISNHSIKACTRLVSEGNTVNIHLVYTLNQGYLAMEAGASYVCPLVGRLHDQGHDAVSLVADLVETTEKYGYDTQIMVSSVRHAEHVRQALLAGAHVCTVPYSVLMSLSENSLTSAGTSKFYEHTKLMTLKVKDVIRDYNPICKKSDMLVDALVKMTESRLGAISVVGEDGKLLGIFTDGDLRRMIKEKDKSVVNCKMSDFNYTKPATISANALLYEAVNFFSTHEFDNLIVVENELPAGILDIQDLVKLGLIG
ncbi:CBS domain-containing protein [candidate division WOR-3 bacterium]|nr:CBS domain-containing protein [candidate division WOR-3 bacterium]